MWDESRRVTYCWLIWVSWINLLWKVKIRKRCPLCKAMCHCSSHIEFVQPLPLNRDSSRREVERVQGENHGMVKIKAHDKCHKALKVFRVSNLAT